MPRGEGKVDRCAECRDAAKRLLDLIRAQEAAFRQALPRRSRAPE